VMLIYEVKLDVWAEGMLGVREDEHTAKPKYHTKGHVARFSDAWDDAMREYFKMLVKEYACLWRNADFMNELVRHWRKYESKHHKRSYKLKRTSARYDMVEGKVSKEDVLMDDEPDNYALLKLPVLPPPTVHKGV